MKRKILSIVSFIFVILFTLSNVACGLNQSFKSESANSNIDSIDSFLPNEDLIPDESGEQNISAVQKSFILSSYETLNGVDISYEMGIESVVLISLSNLSTYIEVYNQLDENVNLQWEVNGKNFAHDLNRRNDA